jgi:hypothetical protein
VLNKSPHNIDDAEWDVDSFTDQILFSLRDSVWQNAVFEKYARFWRERGRNIESVEDLLLAYYSSLQVCHPSALVHSFSPSFVSWKKSLSPMETPFLAGIFTYST